MCITIFYKTGCKYFTTYQFCSPGHLDLIGKLQFGTELVEHLAGFFFFSLLLSLLDVIKIFCDGTTRQLTVELVPKCHYLSRVSIGGKSVMAEMTKHGSSTQVGPNIPILGFLDTVGFSIVWQ
jgi:hypothetical protein